MIVYLYSNKNAVFNYLSRNLIACDSVVKEIKEYRTIATKSEHFIFVTHKKLCRRSREDGIVFPEEVCPLALKIEFDNNLNEKLQIVLLQKIDGVYRCVLGSWNKYDANTHLGAFIIGEIPLSCVSQYWFDSADEMDSFYRPSQDYWYPRNKFDLLPDDFTEELSLDITEEEIINQTGLDVNCIETEISKRERARATMLYLFNATQSWYYGNYKLNMDAYLQSILGISDAIIAESISYYSTIKNIDNHEALNLLPWLPNEQDVSINQKLYSWIYETMSTIPYTKKPSPEFFYEFFGCVLDYIHNEDASEASIITGILQEIYKLISGNSKKMVDEIFNSIPAKVDSLKALLLIAKNPDNYDHFIVSLDKYHVDVISARRASVLWGALNGLNGMPGEGCNKDNQRLWQYIEWVVSGAISTKVPVSLTANNTESIVHHGAVFDVTLECEEVITFEDVHHQASASISDLTSEDFECIIRAVTKKLGKKEIRNRGYLCVVATHCLPQIQKGEIMPANFEQILDALKKCFKSPEPNREKLYRDWVAPIHNFRTIYDDDRNYWKNFTKRKRCEKHE